MAYNQILEQRIAACLGPVPGLAGKKMFGGVGFLIRGNMACGVHGEGLIVRLDPAQYEQALKQPHVGVFDMTGRPMKGWIVVGPAGCAADADLKAWVDRGVAFAQTLPEK